MTQQRKESDGVNTPLDTPRRGAFKKERYRIKMGPVYAMLFCGISALAVGGANDSARIAGCGFVMMLLGIVGLFALPIIERRHQSKTLTEEDHDREYYESRAGSAFGGGTRDEDERIMLETKQWGEAGDEGEYGGTPGGEGVYGKEDEVKMRISVAKYDGFLI